ncbi:hypothetical protein D0863_02667 [Hortaea werneckii]|uniref:Trafficking protein particle complex subunit 12 n=1 Tax=Hortaea werneckii TaxID=91943 RepID=A0A3M7EGW9_HORWE|nr:hypothetical protein D0863_02667 [Hortaea werneckii]
MTDSPNSPTGSVRRHGRNISTPLMRRSTKGPLDAVDDPLGEPASKSPVDPESASASARTPSGKGPVSPPPAGLPHRLKTGIDLRFLQDPNLYHPLPTSDVATAFWDSTQQPPPGTALAGLLKGGHFRRAADGAVNELRRCSSDDTTQILKLLYTRFACLVLVSRPDIAAQEALPLLDFLARNAGGANDVTTVVPWELRLLLVRLQSVGAQDGGRRGIMGLYTLAAEARVHAKESDQDENLLQLWRQRLDDLGLRVADALVEMGELETANRHLDTLSPPHTVDDITYRKALLKARVGDVDGAQACINNLSDTKQQKKLHALLKMADGEVAQAADSWQSQHESDASALDANNWAVSMLYTGRITTAYEVFEKLANDHSGFPALLFNLGTVYELCTERAVERKSALAQSMAAKPPSPDCGGWEKATFDFKL